MNLDDLKKQWAERDQGLEMSIRLNTRFLRESLVDRHGSVVRRWSLLGFLIELPFYVLTIGALGKFIAHHVDEMKFAVPALLLMMWSIAMFVLLVHQFSAMYRLNFGEPIIALQKKLTAIKLTRLRTLKWSFLSGVVIWCAPLWIVIAKGAFDVDLYSMSAFLVFNMLGAGLLAVLTVLLLKRYATRLQRSKAIRELLDSLAGRDIAKASAYLARLANFEKEETLS